MEAKILILTPIFPYPPNDGSKRRTYQILKSLGKRYVLDLISFYTPQESTQQGVKELKNFCREVFIFRQPIIRKPFGIYLADTRIKRDIMLLIKKNDYSIIQAEKLIMSAYLDFNELTDKVLIMDSWGVDSELLRQKIVYSDNIAAKFINLIRYKRHKFVEFRMLKKFKILIAITDEQKRFYEEHIKNLKIVEIPNSVDTDYFKPSEEPDDKVILFTGIMNYYPNIDAVKFFCKEIFPLIKSSKKDISFYIVGKDPTEEILKLHNGKDIIVTGYVEDVRRFLNKAAVFVAPIRMGSGLRNKILEAMSSGKAIVCTKEATEGLKVENKKHLILANSAKEFAYWVIKLLEDKNFRVFLSINARKFVEENYSEKIIEDKWLRFYEEIFDSHNFKGK